MFNIIDKFMNNLTKEKVNEFAIRKNIQLSDNELDFTFNFIKKNYKDILTNTSLFDIDRYKNNYTLENFSKIKKVYIEYYSKYRHFL